MARFPDVCKYCKPPKRNQNCHATCKEYKDAKAEHEVLADQERQAKRASVDAALATFKLKRN